MSRDRELERRLAELRAPDEDRAEARGWEVVRAAYAGRDPVRARSVPRRAAAALAVAVAALVLGLSPAGAAVADLVRDVIETEDDPGPALTRLPASGAMLVTSGEGPWIVREDGSKRLLGDYGSAEATWSQPRNLHVAIADGADLVVVDPTGEAQWSLARAREVADPRWSPSGVRIAYRSGDQLRVVDGAGAGDRVLARGVPAVAPAWSPATDSKLTSGEHVLAYASSPSRVTIADADAGRVLSRIEVGGGSAIDAIDYASRGTMLVAATGGSLRAFAVHDGDSAWRLRTRTTAFATSPDGGRIAALTTPAASNGETRLLLVDSTTGDARRLPVGIGRFTDVAWSPDGRWLVLAWAAADQWLFVRLHDDRVGRVTAAAGISRQFAPGSGAPAAFPGIAGWELPDLP